MLERRESALKFAAKVLKECLTDLLRLGGLAPSSASQEPMLSALQGGRGLFLLGGVRRVVVGPLTAGNMGAEGAACVAGT